MNFMKKLSQVATETANAINNKTNELKAVYEKDKWSGLLDVAEKNISSMADSTNEYMGNLKRINEKVIHETAKDANSSFEAIWKSTFAVSKTTLTFIGSDLKVQALKMYKAWEDLEVEKKFSPELSLLFKATNVLMPEDLMRYCGATRDGAIYTMNGIQVEIYGEIWLAVNDIEKQRKGSLPLLQYIVVSSTQENMSDDFLLRNCLSVMYKIPEVKEAYDALYRDYLLNNPDVTPLDTPFEERVTPVAEISETEGEEKGELLNKIKDNASSYLTSGKDALNSIVSKYKSTQVTKSSNATVDDAVQDFKSFTEGNQSVLQSESPEIIRLREELKQAHAKIAAVQSGTLDVQNVQEKVEVVESQEIVQKPVAPKKTPVKKTVTADGTKPKPAAKKAVAKKATVETEPVKKVVKKTVNKATKADSEE